MKDERFDLESELRESRSEPRSEFVTSLAGDVRGRVRRVRVGLWMAVAGLVVVAVASFGGIGAAATAKHNTTAASAQYGKYKPKTAKFTPKTVQKAAPKQATKAVAKTTSAKPTQLPFTGLALWVPLAIGLLLIAFGVTLRTRAKRQQS